MAKRKISPACTVTGSAVVGGDKSISHRYAILAALAEGRSEIQCFSLAQDCASTLDCLKRLGVDVRVEKEKVTIGGVGLRGLKSSRRALDAGNSGTTMRLLAGVLAGQPFHSSITGDDSLRRRPMRRVIEPLTQMGATIRARDSEFAPLEIRGAALRAIDYVMPVASAQVKSAVLLAGLYADGATRVTEPTATRDHTEIALAEFGADLRRVDHAIELRANPRLTGKQLTVPGDLSSAVFFICAALILPGSNVLLHNVGLNPTRTAVLDSLASMGAPISLTNVAMHNGELAGDVAVRHAPLSGGVIRGAMPSQMIDELPMLAALGPFTEQGIEIRDARELRVKESDRIAALAENLRRMGAEVDEFPDGLRVAGNARGKLRGAEIDPYGDHRIAMAFAIAALGARGDSVIQDSDCAAVSYPDFFATLTRLTES